MNKQELLQRVTEADEFFIHLYSKSPVKQFFQGTVSPGKYEPKLSLQEESRLQKRYGEDTVIVYDRTNEKFVALKPHNVSKVEPLQQVINGRLS